MLLDVSKTMVSDSYFRNVSPDEYVWAAGDVNSPTGWFGILILLNEPLDEYVEAGQYLVIINSDGVVWAFQSDNKRKNTNGMNVELAEEYYRLFAEYDKWNSEDQYTFNALSDSKTLEVM